MFKANNWFTQSLLSNTAWVVIVGTVGVLAAFLSKHGSSWATPAEYGLAASVLFAALILLLRTGQRLPQRHIRPTEKNIEGLVRQWADVFRIATKNDPAEGCYFRLVLTLDSQRQLVVGRIRQFPGYLMIKSEVSPSADEKALIDALNPNQLAVLIHEMRLELARGRVAYSGVGMPFSSLSIFKQIPISDGLNENSFYQGLIEVEAAINSIDSVFSINQARFLASKTYGVGPTGKESLEMVKRPPL